MARIVSSIARLLRRLSGLAALLALVSLLSLIASAVGAQEASPSVMRPGDALVTGFAGTKQPGRPLAPDAHPLDHTFIDPDGTTAQVIDLSRLGGPARGQLAEPASRLRLKARDVGHVFGMTFDPGNGGRPLTLYMAASSLFGLPIVVPGADGRPRRVLAGTDGARFMAGLFGPGGGPSSIWKVDGRTGRAALLANVSVGKGSGAAGLGGLAFDPAGGHLYVADLEAGLIRSLTGEGRLVDSFDHGVSGRPKAGLPPEAGQTSGRPDIASPDFRADDPQTWGFAPRARLVFAVEIFRSRLYYSVAEGPQIWSVGLAPNGGFRDDARLEVDVTGTPSGALVTGISFDGAGNLYIAQRGTLLGGYDYAAAARSREAVVARFRWIEPERRWVAALEEYGVGLAGDHRSATGGVALGFGYDRNGLLDRTSCRATVWVTGEHLRDGDVPIALPSADGAALSPRPAGEIPGTRRVIFAAGGPRFVNGLQGIASARVRPESDPPVEAWFVDLDGRFEDGGTAGHVGNVAILAPPCAGAAPADASVRDTLGGPVEPRGAAIEATARCRPAALGGRARCTFDVRNVGTDLPTEDIVVRGASRVLYGPDAGKGVAIDSAVPDGADWSCAREAGDELVCRLPARALEPGRVRAIEIALDSRSLVGGGNMGLRSCLTLAHPNGHRHACAEVGIELAVRKTGPAECQPGGLCRYALTIANNSPLAFSGPLVIADRTTIDGKVVTLPIEGGDGLACEAGTPGTDPFACRTTVSLAPGESQTRWVSLRVPAPGGYWLQTCFGALDPALLADPDLIARITVIGGQGGAHPSCVSTRVPRPPEQITTSSLIPLLPPLCGDGRRRLADGRCACPLSAPWNSETGSCQPLRPVCADASRMRTDGSCCAPGLVWLAGQGICGRPPEVCSDPRRRTPDGSCCGFGLVWSWGEGRCVPPFARCPDGRPVPASGFCGCPPGTLWSPIARRCAFPTPVCADLSRRRPDGACCDFGTRWSSFVGRCVPVDACPSSQRRPDGGCCPPGSRWNPATRSCSSGGDAVCPDPSRRMPDGKCCPGGTIWSNLIGRCHTPSTQPTCPPGQHREGNRCVADAPPPCPTGQRREGTRCVSNAPPPCPTGQHREGARCVPNAPPPCPTGQHREGARCVPNAPPPCPTGQHREGARCVPNAPIACPRGQHRVGSQCLPNVIPRKETGPSRKAIPVPRRGRGLGNGQPGVSGPVIPRLNIPTPGGLPRLPGGFR